MLKKVSFKGVVFWGILFCILGLICCNYLEFYYKLGFVVFNMLSISYMRLSGNWKVISFYWNVFNCKVDIKFWR